MILKRWFRRRPSAADIREEIESHVAMRAETDGIGPAEARRRFGNVLRTAEDARRVWVTAFRETLAQDAKYTLRSWRRSPGFALAAILVLALGLGSSTALFAQLDRMLFRPLPYEDPDRLVSVGVLVAPPGESFAGRIEGMSDQDYVRMWETAPAPFESVTAMDTWTCTIAEEQPEGVRCGEVDQNFLQVLGVNVGLGRDFLPEDDVRGAPRAALISHRLWVGRYGADPRILERALSLETPRGPLPQVPIIGVLPTDFEMPVESADILLPFQLRPLDPDTPFATQIMPVARLEPEVTPEIAGEMLAPQLEEVTLLPGFQAAWRVRSLYDRRAGDAARVGWLLVGAVATFLLIACVNVTNLMLTRVAERRKEFAVRAAMGAGAIRLARLTFTESLLLSVTAGGIGLAVSYALLGTFAAMAPAGLPGVAEASMDVRVFTLAFLLMGAAGTAIGVWPAFSVLRAGGIERLRVTNPSSAGARPRVRFALVTMQIALTLALLGSSALLLRSLWNVVNVPLGFDGGRVVTLTAGLSSIRHPTEADWGEYFDDLLARAGSTPGAVSVALSDSPPPPRPPRGRVSFTVEGRPADPETAQPLIGLRSVTVRYFETFRIPLISGRVPGLNTSSGGPAVVLNQSAERALFRGESAIGQRIQPPVLRFIDGEPAPSPWYTVVGVSADARNGQNITDEPAPEAYLLARPGTWGPIGRLSLRTTLGSADAAVYLQRIAADLDPVQLVTIETGDQLLARATAEPRFTAWLLTAFAVLALVLASGGLFSVASYLVSQRRREIGIRMALGASSRGVARHVFSEGARWVVAGTFLGLMLTLVASRTLESQLFGVSSADGLSFGLALTALLLTLVVALAGPALRAARVDPMVSLRDE